MLGRATAAGDRGGASDTVGTVRPSRQSFPESELRAYRALLIDGDPAGRTPSLVHSILVARRGRLVLEEYFFGFDRETPHDLRSAGKTFASIMLGAAMMKDVKIAPETAGRL